MECSWHDHEDALSLQIDHRRGQHRLVSITIFMYTLLSLMPLLAVQCSVWPNGNDAKVRLAPHPWNIGRCVHGGHQRPDYLARKDPDVITLLTRGFSLDGTCDKIGSGLTSHKIGDL